MLLNFPNLHWHAAQPVREREKEIKRAHSQRESMSRNAARGKSEWKIALQIFIKHQYFLLFCLFLSAYSSLCTSAPLFDCMRLQQCRLYLFDGSLVVLVALPPTIFRSAPSFVLSHSLRCSSCCCCCCCCYCCWRRAAAFAACVFIQSAEFAA